MPPALAAVDAVGVNGIERLDRFDLFRAALWALFSESLCRLVGFRLSFASPLSAFARPPSQAKMYAIFVSPATTTVHKICSNPSTNQDGSEFRVRRNPPWCSHRIAVEPLRFA